jgi:8-oxo-dGTP pyrophosphatase MutT (NUDIX family)
VNEMATGVEPVRLRLTNPAAEAVRFEEVAPIDYRPSELAAISRYWGDRQAQNPSLFNGPLVAARGCRWDGGICTIRWSRANYADYLWRDSPEHAPQDETGRRRYARALFVSVLAVTTDERLVFGRMAADTSTPGRVQLPGGNVEPPVDGQRPDLTAVGEHAVLELAEETGLQVAADAAPVWAVKDRGDYGDVGVIFRAEVGSAEEVQRTFAGHRAALAASGQHAEFVSLVAVDQATASSERLTHDMRPHVDYLPAVLKSARSGGS